MVRQLCRPEPPRVLEELLHRNLLPKPSRSGLIASQCASNISERGLIVAQSIWRHTLA